VPDAAPSPRLESAAYRGNRDLPRRRPRPPLATRRPRTGRGEGAAQHAAVGKIARGAGLHPGRREERRAPCWPHRRQGRHSTHAPWGFIANAAATPTEAKLSSPPPLQARPPARMPSARRGQLCGWHRGTPSISLPCDQNWRCQSGRCRVSVVPCRRMRICFRGSNFDARVPRPQGKRIRMVLAAGKPTRPNRRAIVIGGSIAGLFAAAFLRVSVGRRISTSARRSS
jgi:hypothetical protein